MLWGTTVTIVILEYPVQLYNALNCLQRVQLWPSAPFLPHLLGQVRSVLGTVHAGIAYDAATGRVWVTGKYWPRLFEISVQLQASSPNALQLLSARQQCIKSNSGFD